MSTFEQTMAALHARHPATLRRILANLPTLEIDTSATDYANDLERELGQQAFDLLTSPLKPAEPPMTGVEAIAEEVTEALSVTVGLDAIANKTADAVASAYRARGWREGSHGVSALFTNFTSFTSIANVGGLVDIDASTVYASLLLYCFILAFTCSSFYTTSVIHHDSAQGARAYKNFQMGIALFSTSALIQLWTSGLKASGCANYVFPAICLGALCGRWRVLLPPSRLWPNRVQPVNAAKTWFETATHTVFFLFCSGFFAWTAIMSIATRKSNNEEWRVFED
ncbi:unnamed protein product [Zymoseptoria tritici ST99CH_1A5]|uniref:Uncharacterized protein n=1 Tax=Zymoseptoria tritici ST99CH_1A5 TaxID=1276529 RepID=A0A1Y6LSJ8_ZYMTR|nr:unnamed protein product [Zymoseptoria tritici ST99CH_1A5]